MVPKPGFVVETASAEDAQTLFYQWPLERSWNPTYKGIELQHVYYQLDPDAFRIGRLPKPSGVADDTEAVSILIALRYSSNFGFISNNIVKEEYRGQGIGLYAFKDALKRYPKDAVVGLDSAVEQVENYRRSGFVHVVWSNWRRALEISSLLDTIPSKLPHTLALKQRVVDINNASLDELVRLENQYAGFNRPKFVAKWQAFHAGHAHRFGVAVLANDGKGIVGYGAVRPAVTSYRIGPLYAPDDDVAGVILAALGERVLQASKDHPLPDADGLALRFEIDVPDANAQATRLFTKVLGAEEMFRTVRQWAGPAPPSLEVSGLYGVCSLEGG